MRNSESKRSYTRGGQQHGHRDRVCRVWGVPAAAVAGPGCRWWRPALGEGCEGGMSVVNGHARLWLASPSLSSPVPVWVSTSRGDAQRDHSMLSDRGRCKRGAS
jgi:hypothetical protein